MVRNDVAPAIGIDLGATSSCVGVWQKDQVVIIPNDQGNRTTPSCVSFTDRGRLIGEGAMTQIVMNPTNTIYDVKKMIGKKFTNAKLQEDMELWPFKVIEGPDDILKIVIEYKGEKREFSAEEISFMILTKLKFDVENYLSLGELIKDAVITVPAYFDDLQRQSIKNAASIAGLNILRIIDEPTAAVIAYASDIRMDKTRDTNILIFDLGGSTLDVSLVTIGDKVKFSVEFVAGDTHIGGQDFENNMVEHFAREFDRKHKTNMRENSYAMRRLRIACEKAKRDLSLTTKATIRMDGLHQGLDFSTEITRAKFEDLNADLFTKFIYMVESFLRDTKIDRKDVDEVILVGGSTRIPKVQELLKDFFTGKELRKRIHPAEVVAYGAAVLAAKLWLFNPRLFRFGFSHQSIGVMNSDGSFVPIIEGNGPTTKTHNYKTIMHDQNAATINVYQGKRFTERSLKLLGSFDVPVRPGPKGMLEVKLVFEIDKDRNLKVSGEEVTTGITSELRICWI